MIISSFDESFIRKRGEYSFENLFLTKLSSTPLCVGRSIRLLTKSETHQSFIEAIQTYSNNQVSPVSFSSTLLYIFNDFSCLKSFLVANRI